jgi:hypothetical protein
MFVVRPKDTFTVSVELHKINTRQKLDLHIPSGVKGEWRNSLSDQFSSPNNVLVIKLRIMRWAGHVACMGERKGMYMVLLGKREGK